jgi:Niemann-Pick C1 protein
MAADGAVVPFCATCEVAISVKLADVGRFSATHPRRVIGASMLLAFVCMSGLAAIQVESEGEKLWVPQESTPMLTQKYITKMYGAQNLISSLIVEAKDGGNMLTPDCVKEAFEMHQSIMALTTTNGKNYSQLCVRTAFGTCWIQGITRFWRDSTTAFEGAVLGSPNPLQAIASTVGGAIYPDGSPVQHSRTFGFYNNQTGHATSSYMQYLVQGVDDTTVNNEWMRLLLDETAKPRTHIVVHRQASRSINDELARSVGGDIPLFIIVFNLMGAIVACVLGPLDRVKSRWILAIFAVFMLFIAVGAGFGISCAFGIPFTSLSSILPFIVVGIGIDDALVITKAFDITNSEDSIPTRMHTALDRCGASILMTSLTNFAAFLLGALTVLPAVRWFCMYAAITLVMVFTFAITWFPAMLAIDEQRIVRGTPILCCTATQGDLSSFMRKFAETLMKPTVKGPVFMAFVAFTAVCGWGVSQASTGFDVANLTPDDSYVRTYLSRQRVLYKGVSNELRTSIVFKSLDYHDAVVQTEIKNVEAKVAGLSLIKGPPVSYWLSFHTWLGSSSHAYAVSSTGFPTGEAFYQALGQFLSSSHGMRFVNDVVWAPGKTAVVSSRVGTYHSNLADSITQTEALVQIQEAVESSSLSEKPLAFSYPYIFFEQYRIIYPELLKTFALGLVAIIVICSVILVNPIETVMTCTVVIIVDLDLLASIYFWGMEINSITAINLVMAIGLVVDFSAHVVHSFCLQDPSLSRNARVIETMAEIGPPVFLCGMTTFVAILPTAAAKSEVFRTFFRMFVCIIGYGVLHGMVLMPILLSWFGSAPTKVGTQVAVSSDIAAIEDGAGIELAVTPTTAQKHVA